MKRTLRYLFSWFLVAAVLPVFCDVGAAQVPRKITDPRTGQVHFTGRKPLPPEVLKRLADAAKQRHGNLIARLPKATAAVYDSRVTGCIPPIRDQGQCGSCWDFSGSGMCSVAFIKAGQIPNSANGISEQYTLDCGQNGGCGGDDNVTVLQWGKATGLPLDQDYGVQYQASSGRCRSTSSLKLYKLTDYGFCSNNGDGVADTQAIKNAIVQYGCVGCAVAAGGGWWNSGQGVNTQNGTGIDHDVILVGWDDSKGPHGAWIMRNSWGTSWGDKCANTANPNPTEAGYGWMAYGADSIGTEAVWCVAASIKPPNPWVAVSTTAPASTPCCGNQAMTTCNCGGNANLCTCGLGCQCLARTGVGPASCLAAFQAKAGDTITATFTTTSDRGPGSYGSALFGISAKLDSYMPAGTYSAVLTKVGQAKTSPTILRFKVPADAVLIVNGTTLTQTGPLRVVRCTTPIAPGRYSYDVMLRCYGVEVTYAVHFSANETTDVDCTGWIQPPPQVQYVAPAVSFGGGFRMGGMACST